ncbi:MAG: hypothetical protein ACI8ZO_001605 [Flavobacteriales bacterium]|jgi:hypothetical protein
MKWQYIISGIVGLLTGAIGSLVAPWIVWKIEKKKENRNDRVDLIKQLRVYLETGEPRDDVFLNSHNYIRIRKYLSDSLIDDLEDSRREILQSTSRSYYKSKFLQELEDIEDSWGVGLPREKRKKRDYDMKSNQPQITVTQVSRKKDG